MPAQFRLPSWLTVVMLLGLWPGGARAGEPQAAFSLVDGDLVIQLRQDDRPVQDVKFRLVDLAGQEVASGDFDGEGNQSVPLPGGQTFLVGLTIPGKKKEADIIVLRRHGKTITPPLVQLSFSKPCCRAAAAPPEPAKETQESPPEETRPGDLWTTLLGTGGGCLVALAAALYFSRRP